MKIGILADIHFKASKNIFDRLEMCKQSLLWAYQQFEKENVDLIVNLGDVYDSSVVSAETIQTVSEVYRVHPDIHEIVVSGNHDSFNYLNTVVSHLAIHNDVEVFTEPEKRLGFSVLSYRKTKDVTEDLLKELSNDVLFSHIDINKSTSGTGFRLPGVEPELLSNCFGNVFNGHIHHGEMITQTVSNVGSLVCHSFSDRPESRLGITIFDTDSKTSKLIENPHTYYFETVKGSTEVEVMNKLKKTQARGQRTILRVIVPVHLRDFARDLLLTKKFVNTRVLTAASEKTEVNDSINKQSINQIDLKKEFDEFLTTSVDQKSLKGTTEQYKREVLDD